MVTSPHFHTGPTKHLKELQGTFKPSKCWKTLQGTFIATTRNYKVLLNQVQNSWKHYKELQGTFKLTTRLLKTAQGTTRYFYSYYKLVENTRNYKVLLNQLQGSWKHHNEPQGTFNPSTK